MPDRPELDKWLEDTEWINEPDPFSWDSAMVVHWDEDGESQVVSGYYEDLMNPAVTREDGTYLEPSGVILNPDDMTAAAEWLRRQRATTTEGVYPLYQLGSTDPVSIRASEPWADRLHLGSPVMIVGETFVVGEQQGEGMWEVHRPSSPEDDETLASEADVEEFRRTFTLIGVGGIPLARVEMVNGTLSGALEGGYMGAAVLITDDPEPACNGVWVWQEGSMVRPETETSKPARRPQRTCPAHGQPAGSCRLCWRNSARRR
jgi:hypothetical protein